MQREMQEICMKMVLKFSTLWITKKLQKYEMILNIHTDRDARERERERTIKKMTPFFYESSTSTK